MSHRDFQSTTVVLNADGLKLALRGYPKRKGLFSGCHGHGFAWPCFCCSEDTATQCRDRGTQV